jgi:arylsulfatase
MALAILFALTSCETDKQQNTKPNIILIMSDDMGYSDIGAYGGEINTPNLDQLASNGLRFTQFYNSARCCPTRASLLTGLYPHQAGIGHMVYDGGTSAYRGNLSHDAVTIAEVLKQAGYSTYMSGKWHITPYVIENPDKKNWPKQRGFDRFFGIITGAGSYYDPGSLTLENEYVAPREGFYATTDFTNHAVEYIKEHHTDNPYFLYVPYTAAHWPMHAPAKEVAKYKGKYDKGWDALREERYQRMKKMGIVKDDWDLTPRDSLVHAWNDDIANKHWEIANMEVYAAMVDIMDQGVGEIIKALKAKGELDNTLIFFLQDNGACAEELEWMDLQPDKNSLSLMAPGELQTKSVPEITRDGKPVKLMKEAWPGPPEGYTAYGRNWANASNTPFRKYKSWVHEGGIATPLIVHWPSGIKSQNEFRNQPAHLIDIMATCIDVAGTDYPKKFNGNDIIPIEGISLTPTFKNNDLQNRAIFWEHEGNKAVRLGKYKLVSKWEKDSEYNWELYDVELDRSEMNNLLEKMPEKVKEMVILWKDWAKKAGVLTWGKSQPIG